MDVSLDASALATTAGVAIAKAAVKFATHLSQVRAFLLVGIIFPP